MRSSTAITAALVGAVGSVSFMLIAGRNNKSRILLALFALWVSFPFLIVLWANVISSRWSLHTRATLHILMLSLTLFTLPIYAYIALGPPRPKTAFVFVVTPPASCLLIAVVLPLAAKLSRRAP